MKTAYFRSYRLGAIFWVLSLQYYVTQVVVAVSWTKANYSWAHDTISDLANTSCGPYGARLVCSPLHTMMNISFVTLGITMISGVFLLRKLSERRLYDFGLSCMALSGIGTLLVGLFPENTVAGLHIAGAALSFVFGNLGMVLIAITLKKVPVLLRSYTMLSGLVGLIALLLFMGNRYLGLGIGGMERFIAYPQSIWMIIFGTYLLLYWRPKK